MDEMDITNLGSTNTKLVKKVRVSASKYWCFTYFPSSEVQMSDFLSEFCHLNIKYIIGREICPSSNRKHFQGYIESDHAIRPIEYFKFLPKDIHWEKRGGNSQQNIDYCSKENDYETNMFIKKPIKLINYCDLHYWQLNVLEMIKDEPDDRTIIWIWDEKGKTGKTCFSKFLCHNNNAIPLEGKKNDILYCAAEHESDLYIWDLERSMENFVSYSALEKIKNGFYMCSKYESKPILRNSPHIIVFANFSPDKKMLSKDRWRIYEIIGMDLISS